MLHGGRVIFRQGDLRVIVLGRLPVIIGREPDCDVPVRGGSVSRRHACILSAGQEDELFIEDMGSRNGVLLSGVRLGGRVPLPESGTIGLGDECQLSFKGGERPTLEVSSGLDRGVRAVLLRGGACGLDELLPGAPPLQLSFQRGRPILRVDGGQTQLNGEPANGDIQLLREDRIQAAGATQAIKVDG